MASLVAVGPDLWILWFPVGQSMRPGATHLTQRKILGYEYERDDDPEQSNRQISGTLELGGYPPVAGKILVVEVAIDLAPQFNQRAGFDLLAFFDERTLGVAAGPPPEIIADRKSTRLN